MLWAFGKLRYKAVRLMDELPLHLGPWLHEFSTADLCCLLAGYTNGRHYHRCERAWCGCMCVWGCAIRPLLTCAAACGRAAPAASTPSSELHVHRTCCGRALSAHTGQPVFFVCTRCQPVCLRAERIGARTPHPAAYVAVSAGREV